MTWSRTRWRRVAGVLLLVGVGVVATGTDSAASVGPDSTASVAPEPTYARAAWPQEAAGGADVPRDRWTWPLLPRPPVIAPFDPPEVRWGAGHRGVDLGATIGQEVLAPAAGVVTFRGVVVDRGVLVIETLGGLRTTFEPVDSSRDGRDRGHPGSGRRLAGRDTWSLRPGHVPALGSSQR